MFIDGWKQEGTGCFNSEQNSPPQEVEQRDFQAELKNLEVTVVDMEVEKAIKDVEMVPITAIQEVEPAAELT